MLAVWPCPILRNSASGSSNSRSGSRTGRTGHGWRQPSYTIDRVKIVFLADAPYVHTRRWVDHFVALGDDCDVISFRPAEITGAQVHYIGGAEVIGKARYLVHARRVKALVRRLQP